MAKVKDFAPDFISDDGNVFGWDTSAGPVILDTTGPIADELIFEGRSMGLADAEALMLSLCGAIQIANSRTIQRRAA